MGTTHAQHLFDPRGRRARVCLLAACGALAASVGLGFAAADSDAQSIDALNSKIAGAREDAQALGAEIDATSAQLASAQQQAIGAASREAELSAVLAEGQEREARLEADARAAAAELRAARARLQRSLDDLADRLVAIYKDGTVDELALLLDSEGFDDLATRAEYLERIEEADAALVARVRSLREQVQAHLEAVERAEAEVEAFNVRIANARDQIAAVRARAEAQAAQLEALRSQREAALDGLQAQVGDWTAEVQRLERISAQEAQEEVSNWLGDWAIPQSIVMCESGGNWSAVNPTSGAGGAYQILPSTWELYGGEGDPEDASPGQQSDIASQIWADSGAAAWECAG